MVKKALELHDATGALEVFAYKEIVLSTMSLPFCLQLRNIG